MTASKIDNFRERLFSEGVWRTERLTIQPLQPADAFQLVVLTNDPLVAAGVSLLRQPFTFADADGLTGLSRNGRGCFCAARVGENGPMVGCVGALVRNAEDIEIGFWLGAPFHRKAYGFEMARMMRDKLREFFPDRRLIAECPRENSASWRLLQKLGFAPNGDFGARKGAQLLVCEAPVAAL